MCTDSWLVGFDMSSPLWHCHLMRTYYLKMNVWIWCGVILLATLSIGFVFLRVTEPGVPASVPFAEPNADPVVSLASNRVPSPARSPATVSSVPESTPPRRPYGGNQTVAPRPAVPVPARKAVHAMPRPEAVQAILASDPGISDEQRTQLALRAIMDIGRSDPVAALQALAAMPMLDAAQKAGVMNQILSHWIVADKATALAWLKDAAVDDATYDGAIVSAIAQLSHSGDLTKDAATLFREFVASGRMDNISDPALRSQAVVTAKLLGVALGSKDYATALQWGFELPADSSAQAYVLSNVAFSQTHGATLPDISWVANMEAGFARTRVVAAIAYGRLLAYGAVEAGTAIRQQLDRDQYDLAGIRATVEQASLANDEKQAILALF